MTFSKIDRPRRKLERKGILVAPGDGYVPRGRGAPPPLGLTAVHDKPLICYMLSTLIDAGVTEIALVADGVELRDYKAYFKDGARLGVELSYVRASQPGNGVAALTDAQAFLGGAPSVLAFADAIISGSDFGAFLDRVAPGQRGAAAILAQRHNDGSYSAGAPSPSEPELDEIKQPEQGRLAGLYLLDARAPTFASWIERTDRPLRDLRALLNLYLSAGELAAPSLSFEHNWFRVTDAASLSAAGRFVAQNQGRLRALLGAPEVAALSRGLITRRQFAAAAQRHLRTAGQEAYGQALRAYFDGATQGPAVEAPPLKVSGQRG
ncbi:MAG: sugar phosphate nucleotidyltransferase [Pseudomonadota bacterium]